MAEQTSSTDFELPVKRVQGDTVEERLTENVYERILPARYLLKDENGEVKETPEELFERVAKNVAQPDKQYDDVEYEESWREYFDLMSNLAFMPNSPTLMNAGGELQQLSACFVVHPEDKMESIFQGVKDAALVFQSGGGMGYPFHLMRPKGDIIKSTGGIASGPISFQKVFDAMCGTIKQGGKRRGAQMAVMRVDHPDILRFIVAKRKEGEFSNFNISVGITEDFMEAVKNDETYELVNPRTGEQFETARKTAEFYNSDEEWYPEAAGSDQGKDDNFWRDFASTFSDEVQDYEINLKPGEPMELPARFIWETMIDGAWRNGEPGLFMIDEANKMHSFDVEEKPEHRIEATNPCGEQPLENYEACNLGHINLSVLVDDRNGSALKFSEWKQEQGLEIDSQEEMREAVREYLPEALDMERFEYVARTGTRFLDNVVTMSDFPLDEIEEKVSSMRKVGLGLMGFAQMLMQLGVRYGSDESVEIAREIQRMITRFSVEESHQLAESRGRFPDWEESKWADPTEYGDWFKQYTGGLDPEEFEDGFAIRNHNTTTIAPTGTTSMIGNTSGGCEPVYSIAYFKNVAKDIQGEDMLVEFDDYFLKALEANGVDVDQVKEEAKEKMMNNEWEGLDSIPDDVLPPEVKDIFVTANQVSPGEHIEIQAAFQHHNHSGISKTCNFPNEASREDVREAYMKAYENDVKGLTVYRDGTRDTQVMQTNKDNTLTDMDKVDMLSEVIDEFGGPEQLLTSNEFEEVVGDTDLELQEEGLDREITQEGVEADTAEAPSNEKGGKSGNVKERPKMARGTTQEIETAYGDLYVTINNSEDNGPFEVFATLGKSGGYTQSFTQALGRMTSLALRTGAEGEDVIEQLDDIRSPQISWDQGTQIHSVPDAIAEAMKRHMGTETGSQQRVDEFRGETRPKTEEEQAADSGTASIISEGENPECPECGAMLEMNEGCKTCPECGWSKCS